MLRATVLVFAATVKVTVPLPLPFVELKVTHVTGLDAVHEQPVVVLTTMLLVPPDAVKPPEGGLIEKVHGTVPACVIVKIEPPAVIVPMR